MINFWSTKGFSLPTLTTKLGLSLRPRKQPALIKNYLSNHNEDINLDQQTSSGDGVV
jgi:hypothetical protein